MDQRAPIVRLRTSFTTVATSLEGGQAPGVSESDLRAQVCAAVDDLHDLGWPPERVIIAIKQLAGEAGLRPSRSFLSVSRELEWSDALLARIVRWCIEQYYHDAALH